MSGSTDVNNIYGGKSIADINAGTVDSSVYGHSIDVDVESAGAVSGTIYGVYISMDDDDDTSSSRIMLNTFASTNVDNHLQFYDGVGDTIAVRVSRAGQIDAEGSINASQSLDYAEYFESKDAKEIAVGTTVKLDGNKIVACSDGDTPLGVIRPKSGHQIVGGGQSFHWENKYLKDDYGAVILESYTLKKWTSEIDFDEYIKRGKTEQEERQCFIVKGDDVPDKYYREHSYHSDRIPKNVSVPKDAKTISPSSKRQKLNPDYDASKSYKSREERTEWHIVGLLGQIQITKGQPISSNWIKMKDVSDTVEMYFVK